MKTADAVVDSPGIYDLDEDRYHADDALAPELGRSLSHSGALRLIDKSPLAFKWWRDHHGEEPPNPAFDLGKAAHKQILGVGAELAVVDEKDWRSGNAQAARKAAYAEGKVPILATQAEQIQTMQAAVLSHDIAGDIFTEGKPEQSFYWIDDETGVTCRGRVDWVHRVALVDLKTTADVGDDNYSRSAATFGYYEQAEWYSRGWLALTGEVLPFVHVVVETAPPHIVRVLRLDDEQALSWARARNDAALRLYALCESTDTWPGPDDAEGGMSSLHLPNWIYRVKGTR